MQPDPARAHVWYVEPDLRSPDGRRLRAVCGTFLIFPYFLCIFSPIFILAASFLRVPPFPELHVWRKPDWI